MDRLNTKALAIAFGTVWGAGMLLVGLTSWFFDWGTNFVTTMSSFYIWYSPTVLGSIIGGIWGFFDGAISGALVAWIYNLAARRR